MDSKGASLSATQGTTFSPSTGTFLIRAPPSSDSSDVENENKVSVDDSDSSSEVESFASGEEGFETASERHDPDEETVESFVGFSSSEKRTAAMPIAQVSGDDDDGLVASEVEDDYGGLSGVVRVPSVRVVDYENPSFVENSDVRVLGGGENGGLEDSIVSDSVRVSGEGLNPSFVENSDVGVLGGGENGGLEDSIVSDSVRVSGGGLNPRNRVLEGEEKGDLLGKDPVENSVAVAESVDNGVSGGVGVSAETMEVSKEEILPENMVESLDGGVSAETREVSKEETLPANMVESLDNGVSSVVGPSLETSEVSKEEVSIESAVESVDNGVSVVPEAPLETLDVSKEEVVLPENAKTGKDVNPALEMQELESTVSKDNVAEEKSEVLGGEESDAVRNNEGREDLAVETEQLDLKVGDVGEVEELGVSEEQDVEDPKFVEADTGVAEPGENGDAGNVDSDRALERVTDPVIETQKPEPCESKTSIVEVEEGEGLDGASVSVDSVLPESADKIDEAVADDKRPVLESEPPSIGSKSNDEMFVSAESAAADDNSLSDNNQTSPVDGISSESGDKEHCMDEVQITNSEDKSTLPDLLSEAGSQPIVAGDSAVNDLVKTSGSFGVTENGDRNVKLPDGVSSIVTHVPEPAISSGNPMDPQVKLDADESSRDINEEKTDLDDAKDEVSDSDELAQGTISKTIEAIMKEMEQGSGSSSQSGFGISRDYSQKVDGQIVSESDEEGETDNEQGDGKELFDAAALAALLKAADGNITISSSDASRIFSVDRPAGLGSSAPSLKPAPRPYRGNLFPRSELMVAGDTEDNMDEEEKKLQEKIQLIRVKFLRLVQRLGHSPDDTIAAQVLYRLSLAEGIRRGRQSNRASNLESAKGTAMQLEAVGKDDLDFSCNILILGKSGVGKSATINSIFGEDKTLISAFEPATTSVKEIIGTVDGVKIRVIDTPGLKPSVMDQNFNKRILSSINKFTKKCSPDIVLYVDRLDSQTRDFNDLPLLRSITSTLGSSIWLNAIVALTHAASAPPDGPNGSPLSYEVFVAQRSHIVQHSIRQAAGDMRLMNPVALVENHPNCRRNREGHRVLPNGQNWRPQLLLLCYSSKILTEANSLLKLQDPSAGKLFGFRVRSPPLPYLLSSLLQSRPHPKLSTDQGGENGDSDIDLDDLSDSDQEGEEDEYDQLPPFKPLRKSQIAKLSKEQRKAYFDEYDYRVKLLQKKQWREELKRLKEIKKRGKDVRADYGDLGEDFDQENGGPAAVPVPLPDMVLPPTFDGDNPAYRYRFLEPTSHLLARPVLDTHGWDHDCGYDGVSLEENLAIVGRFPAGVSVQITKDKKEFNIHVDSSVSAKHGENGSTLAGFDIQTVGKQLAYILRSETKFKNLKRNKTAAGVSVTFLGENVATGFKIEDQVSIGKRLGMVASTGVVRSQGDMAYGANLEARIKQKDYPIDQDQATLGLSLMKWRGDLALGANLQSQLSVGRNSKMAVRVGLNNKLSGQITVRTSSSEQLQIALVGLIPIAATIFRSIWPGESYLVH
eukprot:TRINITY_DN560_c0_g1_i1.p1 TRINITY_DN560_c0_g1~~TRINITY_DN560_c0_g1_i1.p1  ORF type:complete len:1535 (-),score=411.12 TRINITY_DN560_c0_g1_i1:354-4958(-)